MPWPARSDCWKYAQVEVSEYSMMNANNPNRYGERQMCVIPDHKLPPIGASSLPLGAAGDDVVVPRKLVPSPTVRKSAGKKRTHSAASSNIAPEISRRLGAPIRRTSDAVMIGPTIPPIAPPILINPNSRLPCSLLNRSVMNAQNTVTTKRFETLSQTKNVRPIHGCCAGDIVRIKTKKIMRFATKKR